MFDEAEGVYLRRHTRRVITENQDYKNRCQLLLLQAKQTVIDEKQARIDELEQQVKTMIRQVITENLNFKHRCQPLVLQAQKIVIDEKHARIDELEQQVTTMIISSTMIIIIVNIIMYTSVDNEVS